MGTVSRRYDAGDEWTGTGHRPHDASIQRRRAFDRRYDTGVLDEAKADEYIWRPSTRTWRNWQTHQIQVLAP